MVEGSTFPSTTWAPPFVCDVPRMSPTSSSVRSVAPSRNGERFGSRIAPNCVLAPPLEMSGTSLPDTF